MRSSVSRWCCRRLRRFRDIEGENARRSDFYASHRERIAAHQVEKFNRMWRSAVVHVPHYRTMQQARRLPSQFATLEEIADRVPILDRAEVQADPKRFLSDVARPGFWARTGGSTGEPLPCFWGRDAYRMNLRDGYHYQSLWDIDWGDRTCFLWGHAHTFDRTLRGRFRGLKTAVQDRLRNRIRCSAYRVDEESLRSTYERMRKNRVEKIYAYSSAAYLMARAVEGTPPLESLRLVVVSAEPLPPHQKACIEGVLGRPVCIEYGSVELGLMAASFDAGPLRVLDRSVLVETLPGEDGRYDIVATNLRNPDFPLIRYRTGDVTDRPIQIPDTGPAILGPVLGRTHDTLVSPSGRKVHGEAVTHLIKRYPDVVRFQVHQNETDRVRLKVDARREISASDRRKLVDSLHRLLGNDMRIEVEETHCIETTTAGKHRFIVSSIDNTEGGFQCRTPASTP